MLAHSFLFKEIHQQPETLMGLLAAERANIQRIADHLSSRDITNVFIAGRGTSDNAGRYAQYLFGAMNQLPVGLSTPSLYSVYNRPPKFRDALVIGISQSGKSPDIVSVVATARSQGVATLAITNVPDSPLAQSSDFVIPLHAGQESSVAATKTYTTQLMALAMLSAALRKDAAMLDELAEIPGWQQAVLTSGDEIGHTAERYRYMRVCIVIGRGYNYATAFETALKIKELTYVLAEPYSSADFLHGPVALIEESFPTLVIAPSGALQKEIELFVRTLNARGAEVIALSDVPEILELARVRLPLRIHVPEWASPLVSVVAGQLFAMHLAHVRDYDVDRPRGLTKVTETK